MFREKFSPRLSMTIGLALFGMLAGCSGATTTHQETAPSSTPTGEIAKPANTILADARGELLAARSVRVTGTFAATSGDHAKERVDLRLGRGPKGEALAMGTVTTTVTKAGHVSQVVVSLLRAGETLYLRGDRDYYARIDPRVANVAGRWLSLPVGRDQSLSDLTAVTRFAAGLTTPDAGVEGQLKLGSQQAIVVRAGGALAYVSASGRPLLLRLQRPEGNAVAGILDFTDYGAALSVRPPADAVALQSVLASPSS